MAGLKERIIGGFRILQELQAGSGSQGTVYKAVCEDDKHGVASVGAVVALKVMAVQDEGGSQWRKLQKRTAELAQLDHPNVVKYCGCFSEQGMFNDVHVVVQEFLQGETLKERLARQNTGLDVDEGLRVVDSTLAGLEYMAGRGIVHRDLKPGNIFLCDDGGVKLIDFEIAKQEGGTVTASVGNIRGSFDYMAPDFTNPDFHGDVQSDVFSMGVVLHEVLTGKTPYERLSGDDKQANFAFLSRWSQTFSDGHSPIHISSRVKRLLAHAADVLTCALAPKREERYKDFTAFRAGLKSIRYRSLKNGETSYKLLQFIGKGGFGEVFKARNSQTGQIVAIKHLMKAAYAERFHREAKIMRKLASPCFVQLVDFFVLESSGGQEAFLVMAFLDGMPGSSLRDAIKRRADVPMEWRDVFVAFTRYARGLLAMHQQGIYHRDIKPSNLYYPEGHPENAAIMDLGIARDVNGTATTGQVPGTLDYMPPEVVISDSRGDGGMDIYALGLCLYESLTGKMAFPRLPTGTTAYAVFFERAKEKRCPSFDAPEVREDAELLTLLVDMTNPDASRRLKNAGILLKRLESILDSRFGRNADDDSATVAPTIAMPDVDAATSATSMMSGIDAVAIERDRRRATNARRTRRFILLAAVVSLLAATGVAVYHFRSQIVDRLEIGDLLKKLPGTAEGRPSSAADAAAEKAARDAAEAEKAKHAAEAAKAKAEEDRRIAEKRRKEESDRLALEREKLEKERKDFESRQKEQEKKTRLEAEENAKRDAREKRAAEEARRKAEEERLAKERQEFEARQREFEKRQKEFEERTRREAAEKAEREAKAKREADEAAAKAEAARLAEEEAKRNAAAEAIKKAETEAIKKAEAEMAAKMAEMERQLKAVQEKAAKEKAEREAEAKRLEAERRAAEEARKTAERKAEEERIRLAAERKAAEEKAAKEKAEREAEAKRLEDERRKTEEAQRKAEEARLKAEEARKKAEEESKRIADEAKRRADTVKDLVEKAGLYYESEDYYEAVKNYHEAYKNGFALSGVNLENFKDAYRKASEKLKTLKARCENQISLGQTPLRAIKDIDQEIKNLVDWNFDITSQ